MCGGPERIKPSEEPHNNPTMRSPPPNLSVDVPDSPSSPSSPSSSSVSSPSPSPHVASLLLELAANNDAAALRRLLVVLPAGAADEEGVWYGRRRGTAPAPAQMARELRTPLMVAATYGSVEALGVLLSAPSVDVNRRSSSDAATALHCAAASASPSAPSAVRLLLSAGADPSSPTPRRLPSDLVLSPPHSRPQTLLLRLSSSTPTTLPPPPPKTHHHHHHHQDQSHPNHRERKRRGRGRGSSLSSPEIRRRCRT
ncbi:Zinc finger CCCH domain-containing protein 30 [Ananas comosus]|uniref:Zinc finger CCCH domain-containing protein 30 n=1 Tax=Ananas comosus TaxID=4615 RepID=A0A199US22_ANACO|nr:Zinc finger CCCH domain-containing protein 30 [Ananas comosus]